MSRCEALTLAELPAAVPPEGRAAAGRLAALVTQRSTFVWRSLVRLGVPRAEAEDAVQQVFPVAARRLGDTEAGRRACGGATLPRSAPRQPARRSRRVGRRHRRAREEDVIRRSDTGD